MPADSPHTRMQWMDMLRGVAVLLVVVLHAANIPASTGSAVSGWLTVNRLFEPFRMPLLMFLSGVLLFRGLSKPLPLYLWGKTAAIVWPLAVWMVLYGFFVFRNGPGDPAFWLGGDYLWFLMSLTLCYAVAVLMKPLVRAPWAPLVPLIVFLVMIITREYADWSFPYNGIIRRTFYYGAFFFLGAAAARYIPRWTRTRGAPVMLLAMLVAALAVLATTDRDLRVATAPAAAISAAGIAVLVWAAARLYDSSVPHQPVTGFLEWAGRNSIVIYVAHYPVLILLHRRMAALDADPVVHTAVCTLLGMAVTLLITRLRPWTGWLYALPRHERISARLSTRSTASVAA